MNIALILSGGTGTRLGSSIPKQYIEVGEKPIINYCLETLVNHPMVDYIQIVADEQWQNFISNNFQSSKFKGFSAPGVNRQLSIYNGLCDIIKYASNNDCVLIHDAARPLISTDLITNCLTTVQDHDGVLPVLPMKDTVYFSENGNVVTSLLSREKIFAGQAPEVFRLGKYIVANRALLPEKILKINGSTEPAIMASMDIAIIEGDENNYKITTKQDLERFEATVRR